MKTIALIATKEFSDRFRSGWVIACVLVWLGAIGLTSLFGLAQIGRFGLQGYERTVVSLLNLVQYLVPLLALLLGHDLVASEREDRTLPLVVACGATRGYWLLGKFLGGCLTLAFPLALGFTIAGIVIGLTVRERGLGAFLILAGSSLLLGIVFVGVGLAISAFSRTRVQALVIALLAWSTAVFAFDLVALGVVVSSQAATASEEIEKATDATHVVSVEDLHRQYEGAKDNAQHLVPAAPRRFSPWLVLNPVDLFRAINLPQTVALRVPVAAAALAISVWLIVPLGFGVWQLRRLDL
ncbi:MAG: ABC transporter permease [Verrucomicrobia bacterium]|nr:ABC transporter permease [Verrucomicrobiota bacterium]